LTGLLGCVAIAFLLSLAVVKLCVRFKPALNRRLCSRRNWMRTMLGFGGAVLLFTCLGFLMVGLSIETTIPAEAGTTLPTGMQGISNLQLMHVQLLDVIIGCVSGLGACVLLAGAAVVTAIEVPPPPKP
jgi:hypothetical protein